jgi:hypothetical protein
MKKAGKILLMSNDFYRVLWDFGRRIAKENL